MSVVELTVAEISALSGPARGLLRQIARELSMRDPDGSRLARVDDLQLLARQTADQLVETAGAWVEHLGPLHDAEGVRTLLARDGLPISRQAVHKRHNLLALRTGSGQVVYPAFQFVNGAALAGLDLVLAELPESLVSRWTLASWLMSPEALLEDHTPVEVLRDGGAPRVVAVARAWAGALVA